MALYFEIGSDIFNIDDDIRWNSDLYSSKVGDSRLSSYRLYNKDINHIFFEVYSIPPRNLRPDLGVLVVFD